MAHYGFNNHIELPAHLLNNNERPLVIDQEKDTMEIDATNKSKYLHFNIYVLSTFKVRFLKLQRNHKTASNGAARFAPRCLRRNIF